MSSSSSSSTSTSIEERSFSPDHFEDIVPYEEIVTATNNFADVHSQGSRFRVYKAQLLLSGELIDVVARIPFRPYFALRAMYFSKSLKHKNILPILKFSTGNEGEIVVINKYMVNGSLDQHLNDPTFTWTRRLHICVGVACALKYIHFGAKEHVIHRNLKPSKILLDQNWEPMLHGFAAATNYTEDYHLTLGFYRGLPQYMDPAFESNHVINHASDVFAFGVLLFEVLFGMKAFTKEDDKLCFTRIARSHYVNGKLGDMSDPNLRKEINVNSVLAVAKIAYYCTDDVPSHRPSIIEVLSNLEKALELQLKHEFPITDSASSSNQLKENCFDNLRFQFGDIVKATDNFSESCCIGSGGFGVVYKAQLCPPDKSNSPKKPNMVAIKRILARIDKEGEKGFFSEVKLLCQCKHPNIVSLYGFCDEGKEMILVYEYIYNGSLADYIRSTDSMKFFTWAKRLRICIDIAKGLNYLHTPSLGKYRMVHRDIKSANILLDDNWVAKIADFGLSKSHYASQGSIIPTDNVAGTEVYLDPEYMHTRKLTTKSDIYSFGVVLFEIMCGNLADDETYGDIGLPPIARRHFNEKTLHELVDPKLKKADEEHFMLVGGVDQDSLNIFSNVAYQCLAETQSERPTAKFIINELKKALHFQENRTNKLLISLKVIQSGTMNFKDSNCICIDETGYWKLYDGVIEHDNGSIAIFAKRWSSLKYYYRLTKEIQILVKFKHNNIIGLVGYCQDMNENIIVYERPCNGSLEQYLEDNSFTWNRRLKICIDVANVLEFLHRGDEKHDGTRVVHGSLLNDSILLDCDWNAKITNFEYSEIIRKQKKQTSFSFSFRSRRDIHSLGVILIKMLWGRLALQGCKNTDDVSMFVLAHYRQKGNLDEMILEGLKGQIVPESLITYQSVVIQCLECDNVMSCDVPLASDLVMELKNALKFQDDYASWGHMLPTDYKEIIQKSKNPEIYNQIKMREDLYNLFLKGIILQDNKVLFSFGINGERNEMISAKMFSYKSNKIREFIPFEESRFREVAQLFIRELKIKIEITTQFLSPGVNYGAYLIFKFFGLKKSSSKPMYVNLKYKKGKEKLQAYFATPKDDTWMKIELCRFLCEKEDTELTFRLQSLSRYHCGTGLIYVEGIELQVIDKVKVEEIEPVKQILKSSSNNDQALLLNIDNRKKHVMLSAMEALYDSSNKSLYDLQPSTESRSQKVLQLKPKHVAFRINCKIQSQMLSHDTGYLCYLVFKLSEKCVGLDCPVVVRDLVRQNKNEARIIYFRPPSPWNLHENNSVPEEREDGWMEVKVWKFNSNNQSKNDCIPINLKLITYEGTMSGLIVCGLELRPIQ